MNACAKLMQFVLMRLTPVCLGSFWPQNDLFRPDNDIELIIYQKITCSKTDFITHHQIIIIIIIINIFLQNDHPATDSDQTARTPLYLPVQAAPLSLTPTLFSCSRQMNRQRSVSVPMTGVRYNSLLWMCTLNTLTWPENNHKYMCCENYKSLYK